MTPDLTIALGCIAYGGVAWCVAWLGGRLSVFARPGSIRDHIALMFEHFAALWPFTLLFAAGAILVWAASRLARPLLRIFEHASDLGRGGW